MRKVFIDCGANKGFAIEGFREIYGSDYEVFAFECLPECIGILKEKFDDITLIEKAVHTENTNLKFNIGTTTRSGTLRHDKTMFQKGTHMTVEAVDLSMWLMDNFDETDEIIMAMDIEGSEYAIIPRMLETGVVKYLNKFYLEWHSMKLRDVPGITDQVLGENLKAYLGDNLIVSVSTGWDISK